MPSQGHAAGRTLHESLSGCVREGARFEYKAAFINHNHRDQGGRAHANLKRDAFVIIYKSDTRPMGLYSDAIIRSSPREIAGGAREPGSGGRPPSAARPARDVVELERGVRVPPRSTHAGRGGVEAVGLGS